MEMFKVYSAWVCGYYSGDFFVGAIDAKEATKYVQEYIENNSDEEGTCAICDTIVEDDAMEDIFTPIRGIVRNTVWYCG